MGDQKLSELPVWPYAGPVRIRDCGNDKASPVARLPDGVIWPHLPRAGLDTRLRGLLDNQYDSTTPRLSLCLRVEHLAADPRLADEGVG